MEGLLKEKDEAQNIENLVVFGREQEYKEGLGFRAGREQRGEYTEQRQSFILLMKPC
jgi:hypothetical protein